MCTAASRVDAPAKEGGDARREQRRALATEVVEAVECGGEEARVGEQSLLREKRVEALLHVAHVDGERCAWEEEEEASRRW